LTKKNLSALEIDELKSKIPIGRFAETFDITKPIIFLLSTFNTYITGQNIIIDGGYTNV
jgi:3-oxoacyl-[acyl-carrier protein] reductase